VVNKSADGSAKTNSCTRNALFLMDINFFGVKDQFDVPLDTGIFFYNGHHQKELRKYN